MSTANKYMQSASGVGGAGLDVDEVFSTYLYEGNGSTQTISNGIDLSGEGGLVWQKGRSAAWDHKFTDTERGTGKTLTSVGTGAEQTQTCVTQFNSDGFLVGTEGDTNANGSTYVSWTFRKAPKFFDVVKISITRDGSNNLTSNISKATVTGGVVYVNHNLESVPGLWIQKSTDYAASWYVRSTAFTGSLRLDTTNQKSGSVTHTATSTQAMLDDYGTGTFGVGTHEYIIYLFANNDGDGEFGPDADQDIIKCGVFTPNTSGEITVDLGFEPQFLIHKNTQSADPWIMFDTMRGWGSSVQDWESLEANANSAEVGLSQLQVTSTGFTTGGTGSLNNKAYIYIAIRRGPLAPPESATEVFAIDTSVNASFPRFTSNFPVDFAISTTTNAGDPRAASSRLTSGKWMRTNGTNAESTNSAYVFDSNDGYFDSTLTNGLAWMWRRAPNYFDVVCHTSNGSSTQQVYHNLGVVPEMAWIRDRTGANWFVYHNDLTAGKNLILNSSGAEVQSNTTTAASFTDTYYTPGNNGVLSGGGNTKTYVAYLFATLDGISKVGSYTGNGTTLNIDCGFSSGARFVLIKRTDSTGSWWVFDTERGLVAGADAAINLDTTAAEFSTVDYIDPYSAGFSLTGIGGDFNANGGSYIFYAIA